jgi:hypothetical protein
MPPPSSATILAGDSQSDDRGERATGGVRFGRRDPVTAAREVSLESSAYFGQAKFQQGRAPSVRRRQRADAACSQAFQCARHQFLEEFGANRYLRGFNSLRQKGPQLAAERFDVRQDLGGLRDDGVN